MGCLKVLEFSKEVNFKHVIAFFAFFLRKNAKKAPLKNVKNAVFNVEEMICCKVSRNIKFNPEI